MKSISFEEYLAIPAVNFSTLKNIAEKGRFFKSIKEAVSRSMDLGSVVDSLLLPTEIEEAKYFIIKGDPPTASTLVLADETIKYLKDNNLKYEDLTDEIILKILEDNKLWDKQGVNKKIEKFKNNDSFYHYIEGKMTDAYSISQQDWEKANELVNICKTHKFTKNIFDRGLNQMVYTFEIKGVKYKIKLDKLIIDDYNKVVSGYDLKTGWAYASDFESPFYKNKLFLQQALYQIGIVHYVENNLPEYKVDNFKFIYISTTEPNPYPVIYEMSEKWAERGYEGFTSRGIYFKGIKELTEEYLFYESIGTDLDREIYLNEGEILFPPPN